MPIINGLKFSCEPCIRGHRATGCLHSDRILIEVRKPGRPLESCGHDFSTCKCGKMAALFSVGNAATSPDFSHNETSKSPGNAEPAFFVHAQPPRQGCEKPRMTRKRKEKNSVRNQSRVEKKRIRPEGPRLSPVRRPSRETSFSTVSSSDSADQSPQTLDKNSPRFQQRDDQAPEFPRLKAPSDPPPNSMTHVELQNDQQPRLEVREIEPSYFGLKDAESRHKFPIRQEAKYTSRGEDLGRHAAGFESQERSQVMRLRYITAGN